MIRQALESDLRRIVEMSERFYATTTYKDFAPFRPDAVAALSLELIQRGVMLVAEKDNQVVGMVGLLIVPFLFNPSIRAACEVVWWIEPEYQGSHLGFQLLQGLEAACKEYGCTTIQMVALSTSPAQAGKMYERQGYTHSETTFTKVI